MKHKIRGYCLNKKQTIGYSEDNLKNCQSLPISKRKILIFYYEDDKYIVKVYFDDGVSNLLYPYVNVDQSIFFDEFINRTNILQFYKNLKLIVYNSQ